MKHTLSTQEMVKLLLKDEFANWSYEGANALVEFLEEMEQGNETETEFDRVAIRCQFTEYENYEELYEAYGSTARNDLRESTFLAILSAPFHRLHSSKTYGAILPALLRWIVRAYKCGSLRPVFAAVNYRRLRCQVQFS